MKFFGWSVKKIPFYHEAHERMRVLTSRTWREIFRTFGVLGILVVVWLGDTLVQYWSDEYFVRRLSESEQYSSLPLFDTISAVIPRRLDWPNQVVILAITRLVIMALGIITMKRSVPFQVLTVLRRFMFIQSICYLMHLMTLPLTFTPSLRVSECLVRGEWQYLRLLAGLSKACLDSSFSVSISVSANLAFFLLAYSPKKLLKIIGILQAIGTVAILSVSQYHYSISIALGLVASVFTFGCYHLLLLVFCQSGIFRGQVREQASMGFDVFFLGGVFCGAAGRVVEWIDGLDLRAIGVEMVEGDEEGVFEGSLKASRYP